MSRKRVLFLVESLSGGGAEKVLSTIVEYIDHSIIDVTICCIVRTGVYIDQVSKNANLISVIRNSKSLMGRIKYKLIYDLLSPRLIYKFFIPKGYDVEVAFIEGSATRIISGSSNPKSRKIAWVHIDLLNNHWTDIAFRNLQEETNAYRKFDDIVCVSESVKASMAVLFPELSCLKVLYNPVDDVQIRQLSMDPYREDLFQKDLPNLISLGRLVPQKGYDRLLPILKRLHDEGFGFVMNILGEGPERPSLERIISDNEMGGYVHLIGFVANPYSYMCASDLFVCSSRSEGYSTAVTEALILGLPVITTDCSGMHELCENGECGMITDNTEDSLLEGIRRILSDNDLFTKYKQNAERRSLDFSLKKLMRPIEAILLS